MHRGYLVGQRYDTCSWQFSWQRRRGKYQPVSVSTCFEWHSTTSRYWFCGSLAFAEDCLCLMVRKTESIRVSRACAWGLSSCGWKESFAQVWANGRRTHADECLLTSWGSFWPSMELTLSSLVCAVTFLFLLLNLTKKWLSKIVMSLKSYRLHTSWSCYRPSLLL